MVAIKMRFVSVFSRLRWHVPVSLRNREQNLLSLRALTSLSDGESSTDTRSSQLYPGHIPTSQFQKLLLTAASAVGAITDPARDDMVSTMGETSGHCALINIRRRMLQDADGQELLRAKPLVSTETVDLKYLSGLGDGTFGKHYWRFLDANGFDPDGRRPVHFVDDVELAYVMLRYRQIHDFTHTILGMKPNMLGEVAVKWFEAVQTGLPMCITAALFGPLKLGPKHWSIHWSSLLPWAVQNGLRAKFLMTVHFEKHWEKPIDVFRKELGVAPPPVNALV